MTPINTYRHLTPPELDALDAQLDHQEPERWDAFYQNRAKPCPFFVTHPDASLVALLCDESVVRGRALDLGCGNGRNAILLARQGFAVDAVDYSPTAMAWAAQNVAQAKVDVRLIQQSVFALDLVAGSYDLVYDSGCFHHIAPHRRHTYVDLVAAALAAGGWLGMGCFRPEGGSGLTDDEVYAQRTFGGGLGYTEAQLRALWGEALEVISVVRMQKPAVSSEVFGETFLWAMVARKR